MTTKSKPAEVQLSGQSTATPDKPMVKVGGELDDSALDGVAGGLNFARPMAPVVETVKLPAGIGSFHPGAWST